jgi:chaperonin GroES
VEVISMNFRPLYDRVLVKRIEETENMKGGLYIPDSAKEKSQQGEVVAVGKGRRTDKGELIPLDVAVGDRVIFGKYGGNDVPKLGDEYVVMREEEIFGVLGNGASAAKGGK